MNWRELEFHRRESTQSAHSHLRVSSLSKEDELTQPEKRDDAFLELPLPGLDLRASCGFPWEHVGARGPNEEEAPWGDDSEPLPVRKAHRPWVSLREKYPSVIPRKKHWRVMPVLCLYHRPCHILQLASWSLWGTGSFKNSSL